jgi:TIR domain
MADVFISYASEDRERAQEFANALGAIGWSVWWDRKIIVGQAFDQAIERELEAAKSVIVLWSTHSVASEWVKNEAAVAAERGVLVPVLIDNVKLPLEFRRKQTVDLIRWRGDASDPGFRALCEGMTTAIGGAAPHQAAALAQPTRQSNSRWGLAAIALLVFGLGFGAWLLRPGQSTSVPFSGNDGGNGSSQLDNERASSRPSQTAQELFDRLKSANILDSNPNVREWLGDAEGPYRRIAESCLALLGDRRLKRSAFLDVIVPYYVQELGLSDEAEIPIDSDIDADALRQAIIHAYNVNNGTDATDVEAIVQP